jgi:hypothetical protein
MGWDYVYYGEAHEHFHDADICVLRHFLLAEAQAVDAQESSLDTQFSRRRDFLLQHLQRTGDRIAGYGEIIPLHVLQEVTASYDASCDCNSAQPTERYLSGIGRICSMISSAS